MPRCHSLSSVRRRSSRSRSTSHRVARLAAPLIVLLLLLLGCSSQGPAPANTPVPKPTDQSAAADTEGFVTPRRMPEGKGSGQPDQVFPRTVRHFQGQTTLPAEPRRVVVISTGQADAMLTLGVVPVGSTAGDGAELVPHYLFDAQPQQRERLEAITDVGSRVAPNLEAIATLNPDLILMNSAGKDAAALYADLSSVAPTVATQGTGLYWKQDFLLLADALGRTDQARRWLDDFQQRAKSFGDGVVGDPTISLLRKNGDRTRVFGIASFAGSVLEDAGLRRPEAQSFTDKTSRDISAEELNLADADWILHGVQGGNQGQLTGLPLWPNLQAVKENHAVAVDDDAFYLNVGPTAATLVLDALRGSLGG